MITGPAQLVLTAQQKQKRISKSPDKEFIKVTWKPTRELEETKNKWPTLQKHILYFEARKDESSLCPHLIMQ